MFFKLFPILMSIHVIMFALIGKKGLSYTIIQLYKNIFDDREYAMKLDICVCYMWLVANVQSKKGYLDGGEWVMQNGPLCMVCIGGWVRYGWWWSFIRREEEQGSWLSNKRMLAKQGNHKLLTILIRGLMT